MREVEAASQNLLQEEGLLVEEVGEVVSPQGVEYSFPALSEVASAQDLSLAEEQNVKRNHLRYGVQVVGEVEVVQGAQARLEQERFVRSQGEDHELDEVEVAPVGQEEVEVDLRRVVRVQECWLRESPHPLR